MVTINMVVLEKLKFYAKGFLAVFLLIVLFAQPVAALAQNYGDDDYGDGDYGGSSNHTPSVGSLGPTAYVNGSTGSDSTPTLQFTTADLDGDTVQYVIQIDDDSNFSSLSDVSTSSLAVAGVTSYTTSSLADGSYYWRVKVGDSNYATSSFSTANSGSVAFIINTEDGDNNNGGGGGGGGGGRRDSQEQPPPSCLPGQFVNLVTLQPCIQSGASVFYRDLSYGMVGEDVRALQNILITLGFLQPGYNTGSFFGLTQSALAAYQMSKGITPVTGYFGPITRVYIQISSLNSLLPGQTSSTVQTPSQNPNQKYTFNLDLELGAVSEDVRSLQKFLNTHGFVVTQSGPGSPGNETNIFGRLTQSALISFQEVKGITPAVGYFGPKTRQVVNTGL